jgi:hypothetical protein
VTLSRRGVRETVGVPGTGLYATRLEPATAAPAEPATQPALSAKPHAGPTHYLVALVIGIAIGALILAGGQPPATALTAGLVTAAVGIGYEWLAHHHPAGARALVSVAAGLAIIAVTLAGALLFAALAVGAASSRRRRR